MRAGWKLYDKYLTKDGCKDRGRALVKAPHKIDKYKCVEGDYRWVLYIHSK